MRRAFPCAGVLLCWLGFALAQNHQPPALAKIPSGTKPVANAQGIVVPVKNPLHVSANTVREAQTELNHLGYHSGPADGAVGARTRAAIRKYPPDQGRQQTGELDAATVADLHLGGPAIVGSAPAALGRGGKAFGHDVKGGHPVAAAKALGTASKRFGKNVGEGTKSVVENGADKVRHGMDVLRKKIYGTSGHPESKANGQTPNQSGNQRQAVGQSQSPPPP